MAVERFRWTGVGDWFVSTTAEVPGWESVLVPWYGSAEDGALQFARMVPVALADSTLRAVRVQLMHARIPEGPHALALSAGAVPALAVAAACGVPRAVLASACPALDAPFPAACSFVQLQTMVSHARLALRSPAHRAPAAPRNAATSAAVEAAETAHREALVTESATSRFLQWVLFRIATLVLQSRQPTLCSVLVARCLDPFGADPPHSRVLREVQDRARVEVRDRASEAALSRCASAPHPEVLTLTALGSSGGGGYAAIQCSLLDRLLRAVIQEAALFVSVAGSEALDHRPRHPERGRAFTHRVNVTGESLGRQEHLQRAAIAGAFQTLQRYWTAVHEAFLSLALRQHRIRSLPSAPTPAAYWEQCYAWHVLHWVESGLVRVGCVVEFCIGPPSALLCDADRRRFCHQMNQSMRQLLLHTGSG